VGVVNRCSRGGGWLTTVLMPGVASAVVALLAGACSTTADDQGGSLSASGATTVTAVRPVNPSSAGTEPSGPGSSSSGALSSPGSSSTGSSLPRTLLTQSGSGGNTKTAHFSVPSGASSWDVDWSYDCPSLSASSNLAEFAVDVLKGRHWVYGDLGASSSTSQDSGVLRYTDTGTFSLFVTSSSLCTWTVSVLLPGG